MIDYVNKVCFVHIPKNAGQSVEKWFLDVRGLTHEERAELEMFKNDFDCGLPRANDHLTFAQYRDHYFDGSWPTDMRVFAIVRDPIARLTSELAYRFDGRIPPRALLSMRALPVRRMFDDFRCHLQTQASFVAGATPEQMSILRLENLSDDFARLMGEYDLADTPLPHVNHSRVNKRKGQPLPDSVIEWALETYADDFDQFGYDRPLLTDSQVAA